MLSAGHRVGGKEHFLLRKHSLVSKPIMTAPAIAIKWHSLSDTFITPKKRIFGWGFCCWSSCQDVMGQCDCNLQYFINHHKIENVSDRWDFKLTSCLFMGVTKIDLLTHSTDASPFVQPKSPTLYNSRGVETGEEEEALGSQLQPSKLCFVRSEIQAEQVWASAFVTIQEKDPWFHPQPAAPDCEFHEP